MSNEKNYYTIFMPKYARMLQKLGFEILRIVPNKKNPKLNVYQFEDTPQLQRAISEIMSQTNK